jgi:hypothetical protein
MNNLMLGAFYDAVSNSVGPILIWTFTLLLTLETIYVMVKYVFSEDKNKN